MSDGGDVRTDGGGRGEGADAGDEGLDGVD